MSSLQSLDLKQRSATTTPSPSIRSTVEVAKLIDVSKCIGCKACQVACSEWNDLRDVVGHNVGVYDNPADLTADSWTVMRFTEYEEEEGGRLEWLIRKDGCMHCAEPGCLKACPAPGAIVQYSNGIVDFVEEHCIGCGSCVTGCPFNVPRISKAGQQGLQVHAVLRSRFGGPRAGVREDLPDRRDHVRQQGRHDRACGRARRRPEGARLRERRALRSAGRRRHARDVRAEARRQARDLPRPAGRSADQPDGGPVEGRAQAAGACWRWA